MSDQIAGDRLEHYLGLTKEALERIRTAPPPRSFGRRLADDFLEMATSYYRDALHFRERGDLVNAFACVNYAHGWLDCGARLGLFEVGEDDQLFTLYE